MHSTARTSVTGPSLLAHPSDASPTTGMWPGPPAGWVLTDTERAWVPTGTAAKTESITRWYRRTGRRDAQIETIAYFGDVVPVSNDPDPAKQGDPGATFTLSVRAGTPVMEVGGGLPGGKGYEWNVSDRITVSVLGAGADLIDAEIRAAARAVRS